MRTAYRRVGTAHRSQADDGRPCPPCGGTMMRTNGALIGVLLAIVATRPAPADDGPIKPSDLRVLEPGGTAANPAPREMLNRYLLDQAREQFDARRKAIAAIKTP